MTKKGLKKVPNESLHTFLWCMSDIVLVQDRDRIDEAFVNITHAHTPVAAIIFMSSLPLRITISHSETHQSAGS